ASRVGRVGVGSRAVGVVREPAAVAPNQRCGRPVARRTALRIITPLPREPASERNGMRSPETPKGTWITDGDVRREGGGRSWMALVYLGTHLAPLTLFWTGVSFREGLVWLGVCLALLTLRGLCMSAGYHRYFSHRSFKTSRLLQFLLAV